MDKLFNLIIENNLKKGLTKGNFGLEKENIRVNANGDLALTKHPRAFKEENPFIKRDFSESQIEMVTPVCSSIEEVYNFMDNLNNIVSLELKDEYLWPQSNPPRLPKTEEIPVAKLSNAEDVKYRENLVKRYGAKKQLVSGVHFNFSFNEDFLKNLYNIQGEELSYTEFKNKIYFKIGRNFLKYKWFLIYLTGASPVFHKSYNSKCDGCGERIGKEEYYFKGVQSLRNSICGYRNEEDYYVSYNNLDEYIRDIKNLIGDKCIQSAKEYYSPIRFKSKEAGDMLTNLENNGVKYIEIRILDLNPMCKTGISKNTLYLFHLFIVYLLLKDDELYTREIHAECVQNDNRAIENYSVNTIMWNGKEVEFKGLGLKIIEELNYIREKVFGNNENYKNVLHRAKERFENYNTTIASEIVKGIREKSYIDYFMDLAKEYLEESKKEAFKLVGYEDLELSTQILIIEALKNGVGFELLDRKENFICLSYGKHLEYVKQATKTSKDSYITALVMENKLVTKEVLQKNNIRVPKGGYYESIDDALEEFDTYKNMPIVIKPKTTNFGIGITIFKNSPSKEEYKRAVEIAFKNDDSILIEEFIKGKEYRFLIINNEVVGILHRVPANVIGDGVSSIKELVIEKNKDPLRGKGYKTPLEKIRLSEAEEMFLKEDNKDFDYIPKKDEIVYLRENSNISTGGDSIDFTDDIDESYKLKAIEAAKSVDAKITGVDMMIENIHERLNENNYGIIEINFNPAIHIHCFPYKGTNRRAGLKVLKLLFKEID